MNSKTTAIIQARVASSRLPGKVLVDIAGSPALVHVVERTSQARTVNEVLVATTVDATDDPIVSLCVERGYPYYRGSTQDVLDRYYQAASAFQVRTIVRITGDCPMIDPHVIDKTVLAFSNTSAAECDQSTVKESSKAWDFAANRLPPPWGRTYPIGLDTEVCTFSRLELAWKEADQPHQREHVMPFFYEQPERFRILLVNHDVDLGSLRWTLDTPEDLEFIRQIFQRFSGRNDFSWLEVLDLLAREPELKKINASVEHKHYREVDKRQNSAHTA
jgi:spore coat polysaccharide biosynthesis protein SpsF